MFDKIVIVTLKTRIEELIERFNTREQAKFYIEHMGLNFVEYDREHETYMGAVRTLRHQLEGTLPKMQVIDRGFLPNFIFTPQDLVVTIGRDGLVVNTAKYLTGQPIVAVNPDPGRIDGILLPFTPQKAKAAVERVVAKQAVFHSVTMAEVLLNDGQRLLAFNDFFIGQRTHLSARYRVTYHNQTESQSSSGVLVTTGAGSTGWFSSTQNMAAAVSRLLLRDKAPKLPRLRLAWDDRHLIFVVRGTVSKQGIASQSRRRPAGTRRGIAVRVEHARWRRHLFRWSRSRRPGIQRRQRRHGAGRRRADTTGGELRGSAACGFAKTSLLTQSLL